MEPVATRQTLLVKIRDADNDSAWNEFVELYTPLIYSFANRQGLQHADAADVVQESFRAIASAIEHFEYDPEKGSFRSWLYTVARSKLYNHFRRDLKHPRGTGSTTVLERIEQEPDPSEFADWDLEYRRQLFRWAAEKVRPDFGDTVWNAFWKTAVENEEPREVARDLGVSPGSVYVAKCRVINRLRDCVSSVDGDPDLLKR